MDNFKNLVKEFEKAYETCGYVNITIRNEKFFSFSNIMIESLSVHEDKIYIMGDGAELEIKDGNWEYDKEGCGEYILDNLCILILSGKNV